MCLCFSIFLFLILHRHAFVLLRGYKIHSFIHNGTSANLIDDVNVNQRLAESVEDTRLYKSAEVDV